MGTKHSDFVFQLRLMTTEQLHAERKKQAREIIRCVYLVLVVWILLVLCFFALPKAINVEDWTQAIEHSRLAFGLAAFAYFLSTLGIASVFGSMQQSAQTKIWFIDLILSEKMDASSPVMTPPETSK
jgi:uncharacterized PurR-regulated membrane protein YhhQ (DUF165 family)